MELPDKGLLFETMESWGENFSKRVNDGLKNIWFRELREYELGLIITAMKIYAGKEENVHFPKLGQIKAIIKRFIDDNNPRDKAKTEKPCDACLGRGYFEAYYLLGGIRHQTMSSCPCENQDSTLSLLPLGQPVKKLMPDGSTKDIIFMRDDAEIEYSTRKIGAEEIKMLRANLAFTVKDFPPGPEGEETVPGFARLPYRDD